MIYLKSLRGRYSVIFKGVTLDAAQFEMLALAVTNYSHVNKEFNGLTYELSAPAWAQNIRRIYSYDVPQNAAIINFLESFKDAAK